MDDIRLDEDPPGFQTLELPFKANARLWIRLLDYKTCQKTEEILFLQTLRKTANTHLFILQHAPGRLLDNKWL